ncbi:type VII secretion-associated serine protease mycosin, partial [Streptomyces alkaliterrae]
MGFPHALRAVGGMVLAGALLFGAPPAAVADQVREDQWPLKAYDVNAIWNISKGRGVTVAVIDDGVDADHQDLRRNVLKGKSFLDQGEAELRSGDGHGTSMAAIIAGHGHGPGNSSGVMGLAPEAKILPIATEGSAGQLVSAIRYAVDNGASVINISRGTPDRADAEEEAIAYAFKKDVLVVASSGNEGLGPEGEEYPASYPGVVSVGAVSSSGEIWEKSNYGPKLMLTAPGVGIVSAGGGTTAFPYRKGTGTSGATAYVSAAAALLRAKFPDLTAGQIANRLVKTAGLPPSAKDLSLPDEKYGYGYIQPLAALQRDIPAGSKNGPLKVPSEAGSDPSAPASPHPDLDYVDPNASSWNLPLIGGGFAAFVLLVVGLVVVLTRKKKRPNNFPPPGGPMHGPGSGGGYAGPANVGLPHQPPGPYQGQPQQPGAYPPPAPNQP